MFRKTKNIILNTKITVQLKRPALASHSSVPEVGDSMSQDSREQGLYTQSRACTGDFFQPELPSPATRFHGLLACISTNGSFMGGLVTLDRNLWGYSSILVLHKGSRWSLSFFGMGMMLLKSQSEGLWPDLKQRL